MNGINEKETKENRAKINKTKSGFFEKINKIDKPLARLIKKKQEKNQINKIRNENGEITTDNTELQRIIGDYYQQLYDNDMDSLEEMEKFLEKYNLDSILKTREEVSEKLVNETIAKINKTKSWFFEKINKIDKPLARLIKKKGRIIKST